MLDLGVLGFYIFMISFVSVFFFGRWLFVLLYSKRWSNPDGFIDEFITYRHDVLVKSLRRIPTFLGCLGSSFWLESIITMEEGKKKKD